MELFEKITFLRKSIGMNQQDLADILMVSRQTVYKWEQGITAPDISKLPELAKLFKITVDVLLDNKINADELRELIAKENVNNNKLSNKKSIIDYLLLCPIILGIVIIFFMFYCFGAMLIGFLYSFTIISIIAPIYGFIMIFVNAQLGFGSVLMCIAIIFAGLGLIYPLYIFSNIWRKKYLSLVKIINKKIKNFNWRKMI